MKDCLALVSAVAVSGLLAVGAQTPVFAQNQAELPGMDLTGNWAARNSVDANMDMPGTEPGPVDYFGVPINAAARAAAELYSLDQLSEPERICGFYPPTYLDLGPFGMRIWNQTEPLDGSTVAWVIGGWDDMAPVTIWIDGHKPPSPYAAHTASGFTTGVWEDDILKATTVQMRRGELRRNGTPHSDNAVMTLWLLRHPDPHGDILTVLERIEDPTYLTQPYMLTREFQLANTHPLPTSGPPCVVSAEGVLDGMVPFFLPGHNPFMMEVSNTYGIPEDAVLGGAKTMYPEYRDSLKDKYVRPASCPSERANPFSATACGGVGKYRPMD